jgi:CRP-like cAMP-binding protein
MDLLQTLRANPHLGELSEQDLEALNSSMSVSAHPDGHIFIKENARGDTLFLLLEGQIAVTRERAAFSHELKTLKPGELFGQLALIDNEPRSATCSAVGSVRVASLPQAAFSVLFYSRAPVAEALQRAVAAQVMHDFRNVTQQIRDALATTSSEAN